MASTSETEEDLFPSQMSLLEGNVMAKVRKGSHYSSQTGRCSLKDRCELPLPSVLISYIMLINPKTLICTTFLRKLLKMYRFPKDYTKTKHIAIQRAV